MLKEEGQPRKRIRIDVSDLALEVISIVIAILLAFAVGQWQQHIRDQQKRGSALGNIREEILTNLRGIEAEQHHHLRVARAFEALVAQAASTQRISFTQASLAFRRTSPTGFHGIPDESVAWKIAQSDGSASLMEYQTRATITRAYLAQGGASDSDRQFVDLVEMERPAGADNFFYAAVGEQGVLGDVVAEEVYAVRFGCAAIATIDRALGNASPEKDNPCPQSASKKQRIGGSGA